jgi:8-oxo-dGTP diphosphatase
MGEFTVRAAGGLVWRRAGDTIEIALVHRPAYDDWSFPKGKLLDVETDEEAALREVEEETGYVCRLEQELPSRSYRDRKGRPKVVRYWAMEPLRGRFEATREIDEMRWMPLAAAQSLLTYDQDRTLLESLQVIIRSAPRSD